jgi:hypothetical protein
VDDQPVDQGQEVSNGNGEDAQPSADSGSGDTGDQTPESDQTESNDDTANGTTDDDYEKGLDNATGNSKPMENDGDYVQQLHNGHDTGLGTLNDNDEGAFAHDGEQEANEVAAGAAPDNVSDAQQPAPDSESEGEELPYDIATVVDEVFVVVTVDGDDSGGGGATATQTPFPSTSYMQPLNPTTTPTPLPACPSDVRQNQQGDVPYDDVHYYEEQVDEMTSFQVIEDEYDGTKSTSTITSLCTRLVAKPYGQNRMKATGSPRSTFTTTSTATPTAGLACSHIICMEGTVCVNGICMAKPSIGLGRNASDGATNTNDLVQGGCDEHSEDAACQSPVPASAGRSLEVPMLVRSLARSVAAATGIIYGWGTIAARSWLMWRVD